MAIKLSLVARKIGIFEVANGKGTAKKAEILLLPKIS